jgi:pyruvate/2-oxoglutarate dehydrogenase complex dihydrolipoamide dehydrogenase (E3) component
MTASFDAMVIGTGPAGESAAGRLYAGGLRVAVVEAELIGGECAYWACVPSKTLLRAPEARTEADRAQGVTTPELEWADLRDYRDYMVRHLDDTAQVKGYQEQGVTVIRGHAAFTGPRTVTVADRELRADNIIIATGSEPIIPPIEGLAEVPVWTNREATTLTEIPRRALMVGGSAVGVELSTFLARFGTQVTLVQSAERLLDREDPRVGELVAAQLSDVGVTIHTSSTARRAHREDGDTVLTLDDGSEVRVDVIILGAGRRPRTAGLGLDRTGITVDERGAIPVDDSCRAGDSLWAIGDVTAVMPFTHVGMYQGRVAADTILGHSRVATYDGIPRVVFGVPEIAAVGITTAAARAAGHDVITAELDLADSITRPWTFEKEPHGTLGLLADRGEQRLLGAYAVAPLASEWIHQAALAIRARIPLPILLDQVAQYPTYSEAYLAALEALPRLATPTA